MILLQIFVFGAPGSEGPGSAWPIDVGYMGYVEHLLLFSLAYALWRMAFWRRSPVASEAAGGSRPLLVWAVLVFAVLLAAASAAIRVVYPIDQWVYLLGFVRVAFADLPRDLGFFILGLVAFRRQWVTGVSSRAGRCWPIVGVALASFWYAYTLGLDKILPMSELTFDIVRALCIGLVVAFRDKVNVHGRLAVALGKSQ